MRYQNAGRSEDEILQNRFTAYLTTAVHRRKKDYVLQLMKNQEAAGYMDAVRENAVVEFEQQELNGLPLLMRLQNLLLLEALCNIGERERYILLSHTLEGKSFEELSKELTLTYKGTAAIYYRTIQKIKSRMGGRSE